MLRKPIAVVVAAIGLHGCGHDKDADDQRPPSRMKGHAVVIDDRSRAALQLTVAPAIEDELPDVRIRYGRVIARPGDELIVTSPMVGRITEVTHSVGDRVAAKAELVKVAPVLPAAERAALGVQTAELAAQADQADHELALREAELARTKELARDGIVSQAKLQEAEAATENARARLAAAREGREAHAGAIGRPIALTAAADGTLVAQDAVVGGAVALGQTIARILRAGPRRVDLATSSNDPTARGYEVQVGDAWMPAHLVARGMATSDDGNRHDMLELEGAPEVLLGSTVAVRLAAASARGVVVPDTAVLPSAGGDVVYVESDHGVFEAHVVRIAARFGGRLRLASGIKPGEPVVVRGASALRGEALRSSLNGDED
jgi:RND family efflux transporter MFP subunit